MRIVHVTDTFAPVMGGIETQVARLAAAQVIRGNEVIILTTAMAEPARGLPKHIAASFAADSKSLAFEGEAPADITIDPPHPDGYTVMRSQWRNPLGAPVDPAAPERFIKAVEWLQPDVVHAHLGELTPVATAVLVGLKDRDVPLAASVHSVWSKFPTIPLYTAIARAFGLNDAPIVWLPNSELTAGRVRQVVNSDLVHVMNNSVDPTVWEPESHLGNEVRGRATAALRAVTATRFAPRKRVPALLRMLREVGERLALNETGEKASARLRQPLRVVVAGEGPTLPSARRYLRRHGMTGWVDLPGRLSQEALVALYADSDVYLAPSVKDAFSISGLEARAAGLAILTRSQSGFGAATLDGVEGCAVRTDKEMADVLVRWVRNPKEVAKYRDHNRNVPIPYSWENALPIYEERYRQAAALRRGTGGAAGS